MARCIDCRERDASSTKTLCQRCYKRRLGGRPRLITLRRVGDPDGHGQYGILDVDEESVLCHECGRRPVDTGRPLVGRVACQCPMVLDHHQADCPIRPSGSGITSSRM